MQNNVANKSTNLKIKSCLETTKAPWEICQKKAGEGVEGGGGVWDARCGYLQDDVRSEEYLLHACKGSETHTVVMIALQPQAFRWTFQKLSLQERLFFFLKKQKTLFHSSRPFLILDITIWTITLIQSRRVPVTVLRDRLLLEYFNLLSRTQ